MGVKLDIHWRWTIWFLVLARLREIWQYIAEPAGCTIIDLRLARVSISGSGEIERIG